MPIWLPGTPTCSKWRNSAYDCLDILHWHANSVIGAASGMEHPTVLHLHLARVILLTPIQQILDLTRLLTDTSTPPNELQTTVLRKHIQRWALEDSIKRDLPPSMQEFSSGISVATHQMRSMNLHLSDSPHYPSRHTERFASHTPPKRANVNNTTSPESAPQDPTKRRKPHPCFRPPSSSTVLLTTSWYSFSSKQDRLFVRISLAWGISVVLRVSCVC